MFGLFGGGGNSAGTAASSSSSRVQRAQALRRQRLAASNNNNNNNNKAKISGATSPFAYSSSSKAKTKTKKKTDAVDNDDEDEVLVVSGLCTIFCAFLIICLGAALATVFFMLQQPDCMKGVTFGIADAASFASPDVQEKAVGASASASGNAPLTGLRRSMKERPEGVQQAAAAAAVLRGDDSTTTTTSDADATFIFTPPQCTPSQMARLAEQLPAGGCERSKAKPWRRTDCSFSMATLCNDPTWFHQHYAKVPLSEGIFTSIHVGCNKGYQALDMLAIGNKNPPKYDWTKWQKVFLENPPEKVEDSSESCPHPDIIFKGKMFSSKGRAFCIEPVPKTFQRLKETKEKLGIGDELHLSQLVISSTIGDEVLVSNKEPIGVEGIGIQNWLQACGGGSSSECTKVPMDTLDHWITTTPLGASTTDPIHYMSLALQGYDYLALVGGAKTLSRLHYLDVQYHWYGDWAKQSLKDMVDRLQRKHFVCYFAGDENLWRITDCWQDHYSLRYYANIACVNTHLAGPLAKEMEEIFERTLEKNLKFGAS